MPFNGAGIFSRTPGTRIANQGALVSAQVNDETDNLVNGVNGKVNLDGLLTYTGLHTLFGDGTALLHQASVRQVQNSVVSHATAVGGTVDAIQLTMSPANTTLTTHEKIRWKSAGANTITAPTLSKDGGVTNKTIKKGASAALAVGDLGASGQENEAVYNGTDWILLNSSAAASGSITASGYTQSTARLLGRTTASTGAIEELTVSGSLSLAGGNLGTTADVQTFTASGTWTKPATGTMAYIQVWGGGGSGASRTTNGSVGGGGGGGYNERWVLLSSLGATETVTIPAAAAGVSGDTAGNAGGDATFGAWLTGYGGGGGETNAVSTTTAGGYGAGQSTGSTGIGVTTGAAAITTDNIFSGAKGASINASNAAQDARVAHNGGGGGGSACSTGPVTGAASTSFIGGGGGAANGSGAGTAGTQPAGGGGASRTGTSGAGAKGKVIVTVI